MFISKLGRKEYRLGCYSFKTAHAAFKTDKTNKANTSSFSNQLNIRVEFSKFPMKEEKPRGTVTEYPTVILNKMLCYDTALFPREGLAIDGEEFTASFLKGRKH